MDSKCIMYLMVPSNPLLLLQTDATTGGAGTPVPSSRTATSSGPYEKQRDSSRPVVSSALGSSSLDFDFHAGAPVDQTISIHGLSTVQEETNGSSGDLGQTEEQVQSLNLVSELEPGGCNTANVERIVELV